MVYITNNNRNDGKHFKNNFEQTQNAGDLIKNVYGIRYQRTKIIKISTNPAYHGYGIDK